MAEIIEHTGVVTNIEGSLFFVEIEQLSACAECHVKGICSSSDKAEKIVEVYSDRADFVVGERVLLLGSRSLGLKAAFWAYIVPFLLILVVLFVLNGTIRNEAISGTLALASLVPYYFLLSRFKTRLKKTFTFQITKLN